MIYILLLEFKLSLSVEHCYFIVFLLNLMKYFIFIHLLISQLQEININLFCFSQKKQSY